MFFSAFFKKVIVVKFLKYHFARVYNVLKYEVVFQE